MKDKGDLGLTTTALVNNVHCASCVAYIQDVFSAFGPAVQRVEVNILSHEVWLYHQGIISTSDICRALIEAAFEVNSATTVDSLGEKVQELNFRAGVDGWLGVATDRFSLPSQNSLTRLSCFESSKDRREEKHLANCVACRDEGWANEKPTKPIAADENSSKLQDAQFSDQEMQRCQKDLQEYDQRKCDQAKPKPLNSNTVSGVSKSSEIPTDQDPPIHSVTLSLGGMTCASCSASITRALETLSYVQNVNVSLMTNSATIIFLGSRGLTKEIIETIEESGFEASIAQYNSTVETILQNDIVKLPTCIPRFEAVLSIGGMTCASCTAAIEVGLRELPYVEIVDVTLMTNSGVVIFSDETNLLPLIQTVEDLGYECVLENFKAIGTSENEVAIACKQRALMLNIHGMFCKHCPKRIVDAITSKYPELVINKPPTLKDPTMAVFYTPHPPKFTIRDVVATIDSLDESFAAGIFHPPTIEERSQGMKIHEQHRLFVRLLLSFIVAIPTFLIGVVWMSLVPSSNKTRVFFEHSVGSGTATRAEYALFGLATPVMFFAADVFHVRAVKEVRALWRRGSTVPILRRFYRFGSMNLLMSAGTSVAYFASIILLIMGATSKQRSRKEATTYFDSVVFLTFFILGGRYLEAYSKSKAGNAVAMLGNLRPQEAVLVDSGVAQQRISQDNAEAEMKPAFESSKRIDTSLLEIGDVVIVPHGSSPPADGIIINGTSNFNESSLTGESRAARKSSGDKVFTGTVNIGESITIQITDIGGTSMLDQIISVVREGQTKRAPVERVVDSLTGYFVPMITALAILTFVIWFSLGQSGVLPKKYLDGQQGGWAFWSLEFAIAVFVVACPCGIGLAAPTALFVGGGLAAKNGILVRGGGEAFQEASNIDVVVFDKTGTLTEGESLKVTNHEMLLESPEADIAWAVTKSMEENSSHPIARAILEFASVQSSYRVQSASIQEVPGLGLRGTFTCSTPISTNPLEYEAALGSESFISSLEPSSDLLTYFTTNTLSLWKSQSKSIALLAIRPTSQSPSQNPWSLATIFAVTDPVRPSALPTISALKSRGIAVYMLTGDNPTTAAAVAASLSIPLTNVFAGVLPNEKAAKIEDLQIHGPRRKRHSSNPLRFFHKATPDHQKPVSVAFIGDGINDSPALTAASVSISLASASDIALSSSHFVLLSSSLDSIIALLDLSQRVFRRVKFNFAWALSYNVCLVPVAAGVLFWVRPGGWRLGPVWGSAAMAGSSVSVVASSLALRWGGRRRREE